MKYHFTREEAVEIMADLALAGYIGIETVRETLLAEARNDQKIAGQHRKARQFHTIDMTMPTDPRLAQILALDT